MYKFSASAQPVEQPKTRVYRRHREILNEVRSLHLDADRLIEGKVESRFQHLLHSKSTDAVSRATAEGKQIQANIQEKVHQFQNNKGQDPCQLPEAVAEALTEVENQIKNAQTAFDGSMKEAGETLQTVIQCVSAGSKFKIVGLKESHLNSVRAAWKNFNDAVMGGLNDRYVSGDFEPEVAHAQAAFVSARDNFLKTLDGLGNDEYEMAVTQAMAEFQTSVSKAQAKFYETIDTLVKEQQEVKVGADLPATPPGGREELKPGLHRLTVREADRVVQSPLENSTTLEKLVQDVAKIAQRLDNLEGKMEEILKNIQALKGR